jgi:DNA (cytosine-5)-methyltransferase 1
VTSRFRFVDLFAGIGGFHAVLSIAGGECVSAIEIDPDASSVYERNWGLNPLGDITKLANDNDVSVPNHDILAAGFPCQPFSKSGAQLGMEETRGTLFYNILNILNRRKPLIVVLENVRNLAGPRHVHEMKVIVESLRELGYRVSDTPSIVSPHRLPPSIGGRPQNRERVFITGTFVGKKAAKRSVGIGPAVPPKSLARLKEEGELWSPDKWNLNRDLLAQVDIVPSDYRLGAEELRWLEAWEDFIVGMRAIMGTKLPGFPLWASYWTVHPPKVESFETPEWKRLFIQKNREFYIAHKDFITAWRKRHRIWEFPPSRQKLEWQAQNAKTFDECVIHFRPSGIRAKRPTYLPALVAMTQTSVIGSQKRRLSTHEAKLLQGLPQWFDFGQQSDARTFRQLGNGVSIGAAWYVLRRHLERDSREIGARMPQLLEILELSENPDDLLVRDQESTQIYKRLLVS